MKKKSLVFICVLVICLVINGCSVLSLPFQIVGSVFELIGKVLDVAKKVPMPPPGVF